MVSRIFGYSAVALLVALAIKPEIFNSVVSATASEANSAKPTEVAASSDPTGTAPLPAQATEDPKQPASDSQIAALRSILAAGTTWARPADIVEGTRADHEWRRSARDLRAEIPFSVSGAEARLAAIGAIGDIETSHPIFRNEALVDVILDLPEQRRAALSAWRIEDWRCLTRGTERHETLRAHVTGVPEPTIPGAFTDCWFPIETRGSVGAISDDAALLESIRAWGDHQAGGRNRPGSLIVDEFLRGAPFRRSDSPFFGFSLYGRDGVTVLQGNEHAMRNDMISFDGYALCFDDRVYINECHVAATRVENLGTYPDVESSFFE